jgi:deoxycytidine triphosphate deaminase
VSPELPKDIGEPSSVLTDADIRAAGEQGFLFSRGFDPAKVKYSSYELRINGYELLTFETTEDRWSTPHDRTEDTVVLHPGETARVFASEILSMPDNVLAHAIPVGQLFASGLAAETTFADPGYAGDFYVTLINLSNKNLSIAFQSPLARLEFYKLGKAVEHPHDGSRRSPKFVIPSDPRTLTDTELAARDLADWIRDLVTPLPSDRYDRRYQVAGHVLSGHSTQLATVQRAIARVEAWLIVIGLVLVGILVVLLWPIIPESIAKEISRGVAGPLVAAVIALIVLLSKGLRKRLATLITSDGD